MTDPHHVKINSVNIDLVSALNKTMSSALEANDDLRATTAAEIEKRGYTYPGDKHQGWGLGGRGLHGTTSIGGTAPYFGRGLDLQLKGFSLQPFGIGTNGLLAGGGVSSSIFSNSGANVRYSRTTHISRIKMALCVEAYKGFGIVKNVIDLMCNFASEGLTVSHPSPSVQRFYERWFEAIDMNGRAKHGLRSYYKHGNVFIYTTMGQIDDFTYKKMRSARGGSTFAKPLSRDSDLVDTNDPNSKTRKEKTNKEKDKPVDEKLIPWRYTFLNPFQMDLRGSKFFGQSEWVFILDEFAKADIKSKRRTQNVDVLDETDVNLPPEFKSLTEDGNAVLLDQDKLWTLHYMKDDHEDWADPMVWPVMNDIMYKNSLRSMDMSVVNSTINAITIFKLGDVKSGYVAPASHYKKLSTMLRTPTYSHNIVWNDAIQMESNYPPIEKILSQDKYRSVDRDILAGLGIPGILVNGAEGGSFSNAFLQVRTLLERLEDGREEIKKWITKQLRIVAEIMGHRQIPIVKFGQMSLRDEEAQKKLIIQLIDRNLISAESVHEVFGMNTTVELERMRREQKLSDEQDLLVKFGPYRDPMNFMDTEETMQLENKNEMKRLKMQETMRMKQAQQKQSQQKKQAKGPQGRPGGINTPQEEKRKTKPQGMGLGTLEYELLREKAISAYESVEEYLTSLMLKSRDVDYKKSLSKADRDNLDGLIGVIFSNVSLDEEITEDYVNKLLENPSLHPVVGEYYRDTEQNCGPFSKMTAAARRRMRAVSMLRHYRLGGNDAV
jgi:hypothetical protein